MTIRNLLIALPTVGHFMKSQTAIAVASTVKALQQSGIDCDLHNIDSAEIVTARDMFANMLLHSPKWDAMLFIDSDMGYPTRLIPKMIKNHEQVTAAACPRRLLDLDRFVSGAQSHGNLAKARADASQFTVVLDWNNNIQRPVVKDGFCNAAAVGMAIALISKSALVTMVDNKVVAPRFDLNSSSGEPCYSFFAIVENNGHRLGEDYSFCYRWSHLLKNKIRLSVDEEISHVGDFVYRAKYLDLL
jgi:hypothetical protein